MRLFIGLPVPPEIQSAIQTSWKKVSYNPVSDRPMKPKTWHVTLAFLDDVPDEKIGKLIDLVQMVAKHPPAGSFSIEAFESFPSRNPSRVVATILPVFPKTWTMFVDGVRDLASLIAPNVDRKPWKPHISIIRQEKDLKISPWSEKIEPIIWEPAQLSIIKGTLTPTGSVYESLYVFPINI